MISEKLGIALIVIAALVASVVGASISVDYANINQECITHGYPDVIRFNGLRYCHRLLNGTDEIILVKELDK